RRPHGRGPGFSCACRPAKLPLLRRRGIMSSDGREHSLDRGPGRPVKRRTRTFRPNYLMLASTYQCNLNCPHCCVPIEWPDRLDIAVALRFLEDARAQGIGVLGFTGGEPFLYPEFLHKLCRRGADLGFHFDKIMTNGVWHRNAAHLEAVLTELHDA